MIRAKLLIIADDFTGGLDTGVKFAEAGISVRVIPEPVRGSGWIEEDAEVLVAVCETRHSEAREAYERVYDIASEGVACGIRHIYKKTDSALRGNVGAELKAALDASGAGRLVFIPAFPGMNRITVKGIHYIDGVPLSESIFKDDPFDPVSESEVSKLIGAQTDELVVNEDPEDISGVAGIHVVNAASDDDMVRACERLKETEVPAVLAGCAGFAGFLPGLLGLDQGDVPEGGFSGDGLLVVSGSINPITLKQLDHAEKNGFRRVHLTAEELLGPESEDAPEIFGEWVIIDTGDDTGRALLGEYARKKGLTEVETGKCISEGMAEMLRRMDTGSRTLMVIGGDTLLSCMRKLGITGIRPVRELFPGVVLSECLKGEKKMHVISKSGGFGEEGLLTELREICMNGAEKMRTEDRRPLIGITMGDPASIGPEITVRALDDDRIYDTLRPLVVGDSCMLRKALGITGVDLKINPVIRPSDGKYECGTIDVLDMGLVDPDGLKVGEVSAEAGEAAFRYVEKVIKLAMNKEIDATVTNALNKEAVNLAGHHFAGHTEIYAHYTGTDSYTMMLAHEELRVVHVSTHVSLREACDRVKKDRVLEVIRIADRACRDLGIEAPVVGVSGLNPHSGENGLFGREEIDEIIPAIDEARSLGINAVGPVPPDTVFSKALGGWYDIVVAMYHDQGHIPLKVVGFVYDKDAGAWQSVKGVNITLGLPIIRVSVDHGTAFDQAGKGTADPSSLLNAIDYAARLAGEKHN